VYFTRLEEIIINEENVDSKLVCIREVIKIMFKLGIMKLSKKKSTLEEIDSIRKDIGLSPLLMIQSKLTSLFNNILKGIITLT
jgi:hypothetical protein